MNVARDCKKVAGPRGALHGCAPSTGREAIDQATLPRSASMRSLGKYLEQGEQAHEIVLDLASALDPARESLVVDLSRFGVRRCEEFAYHLVRRQVGDGGEVEAIVELLLALRADQRE